MHVLKNTCYSDLIIRPHVVKQRVAKTSVHHRSLLQLCFNATRLCPGCSKQWTKAKSTLSHKSDVQQLIGLDDLVVQLPSTPAAWLPQRLFLQQVQVLFARSSVLAVSPSQLSLASAGTVCTAQQFFLQNSMHASVASSSFAEMSGWSATWSVNVTLNPFQKN